MPFVDIPIPSSFQNGIVLQSENPLEEVWDRISWMTSKDRISSALSASVAPDQLSRCIDYSVPRFLQACELRKAKSQTTALTAPLLLYYSALNLTRGALALIKNVTPHSGHGLKFKEGADIFSCSAEIANGTYYDLLLANNINPRIGTSCSLMDALIRIVEISDDMVLANKPMSLIVPIYVLAYENKSLFLNFKNLDQSTWKETYPSLSPIADFVSEKQLRINIVNQINAKTVSEFCHKHLLTDLHYRDLTPQWFVLSKTEKGTDLSREGYYLIALFILSSIVRYSPEIMIEALRPERESSYIINRFIKNVERFYPQLIVNSIHNNHLYFSNF